MAVTCFLFVTFYDNQLRATTRPFIPSWAVSLIQDRRMSTEVYPPLPPDQLLKEEEASLVLLHFLCLLHTSDSLSEA